jgi:hypothetical protein
MCLWQCPLQTTTGDYAEAHESSQHPQTVFIKKRFILSSHIYMGFPIGLFFHVIQI